MMLAHAALPHGRFVAGFTQTGVGEVTVKDYRLVVVTKDRDYRVPFSSDHPRALVNAADFFAGDQWHGHSSGPLSE